MAVNVKMGVDIGKFTAGIKQGQQILKGLNAEMKASEAEFKATGNAEQKLNAQTKTLNSQLNVQKGIADQARQALKKMTDQGIDPADAAYQKLYVQMLNAEAGANEAQAALTALGDGTAKAADGADKLSNSLNGISKKLSLDQVINGVSAISSGLEKAAQKAIQLGEEIWNTVMNSARWADDTATQAQMYGIDVEEFQKMQNLVKSGLDTSVEAMLKSQQKLRKGIGEESKGVMDTLEQLRLSTRSLVGDEGVGDYITKDQTELFWEAGRAIMNMKDEFKQEAAAQDLFGRSWQELIPLFSEYPTLEKYNEALTHMAYVSEEQVKAGAELSDKIGELETKFDTLKHTVLLELAPALSDAATSLSGLLDKVLEYLASEEGQEALKDMREAVSGLFDDLGKIDPDKIVEGFTSVFDKIVGGLQWLVDNKGTLIGVLEGVVAGWAGLKLTGGALQLLQLINGLTGLGLIGSSNSGAVAAEIAGGSLLSGLGGKIAELANFSSVNGGPIIDWLFNESPLAGVLSGRESISDLWGRFSQNVSDNASTFQQDWENNALTKPFIDLGENSIRFWDQFYKNIGNSFQPSSMDTSGIDISNLTGLNDASTWEEIQAAIQNKGPVEVETDPTAPDDAAQQLADQIGTIYVNVVPVMDEESINTIRRPRNTTLPGHANGLWSVPYDGYLAQLHKGERVVPAREISSRNYSSNLYVESMYMNSGTDAAGLAAAMAAAQRRQMSGYGS